MCDYILPVMSALICSQMRQVSRWPLVSVISVLLRIQTHIHAQTGSHGNDVQDAAQWSDILLGDYIAFPHRYD